MSMSVGGLTSALPNLHSVSKSAADCGSDPLGNLLNALDDSKDAAAPSPVNGNSLTGGYDPKTLAAMISAQGQSGDAGPASISSAGGSGAASDAASSPDSDNDADGSTTQSVTNPDGSITTTVTTADGSQTVNTTAPPQGFAALSSDLQKLQSLLTPVAETALMALLI
jgi:hypothetical protein